MVTQGCVVITSELYQAGTVTVPAGTTPIAAKAQGRRTSTLLGRAKVVTLELPVSVSTNDLVIDLAGTIPGDLVCWTAYSS
jgi:hypothetical protein